jgi:hypothetical protein
MLEVPIFHTMIYQMRESMMTHTVFQVWKEAELRAHVRKDHQRSRPLTNLCMQQYAWKTENNDNEAILMPSQELTQKMVLNQTIDIKSTKLMVLTSRCVPEFPDSEWNNVLSGKAVNLDTAFSGMFSTVTDN